MNAGSFGDDQSQGWEMHEDVKYSSLCYVGGLSLGLILRQMLCILRGNGDEEFPEECFAIAVPDGEALVDCQFPKDGVREDDGRVKGLQDVVLCSDEVVEGGLRE